MIGNAGKIWQAGCAGTSATNSVKSGSVKSGSVKSGLLGLLCLVILSTACQKGSGSSNENPPTSTPQTQAAPPPQGGDTTGAADEVELEYWRTVKDSEHSDDLWAYLEKYPSGAFADLARSKLERLMRDGGEAKAAPAPVKKKAPAAAPSDDAPSVRRTREQIVRDAVRRTMRRYSDARSHAAPNIPRRKLDNVSQVHNIDKSRILFLYDDGFSGGGKTGFCLTDRKVYWRFISGSPAYFLDFEDIDQVRVMKKKFTINGYDVGTTMAADPARAAEMFADLLEDIRDQLRRR